MCASVCSVFVRQLDGQRRRCATTDRCRVAPTCAWRRPTVPPGALRRKKRRQRPDTCATRAAPATLNGNAADELPPASIVSSSPARSTSNAVKSSGASGCEKRAPPAQIAITIRRCHRVLLRCLIHQSLQIGAKKRDRRWRRAADRQDAASTKEAVGFRSSVDRMRRRHLHCADDSDICVQLQERIDATTKATATATATATTKIRTESLTDAAPTTRVERATERNDNDRTCESIQILAALFSVVHRPSEAASRGRRCTTQSSSTRARADEGAAALTPTRRNRARRRVAGRFFVFCFSFSKREMRAMQDATHLHDKNGLLCGANRTDVRRESSTLRGATNRIAPAPTTARPISRESWPANGRDQLFRLFRPENNNATTDHHQTIGVRRLF